MWWLRLKALCGCRHSFDCEPAPIATLTSSPHFPKGSLSHPKGKTKKIIWELYEQAGWGFSAKRGFALCKVAERSEGWNGRRLTSGNSFTSGSIRTDHQGDSPTFHKGFLRFLFLINQINQEIIVVWSSARHDKKGSGIFAALVVFPWDCGDNWQVPSLPRCGHDS